MMVKSEANTTLYNNINNFCKVLCFLALSSPKFYAVQHWIVADSKYLEMGCVLILISAIDFVSKHVAWLPWKQVSLKLRVGLCRNWTVDICFETMDCLANDGSLEEFYLVLLDGRSRQLVRWLSLMSYHKAVATFNFVTRYFAYMKIHSPQQCKFVYGNLICF